MEVFPKRSQMSSRYKVSFVGGPEWREALTYFVYIVIKLKNDSGVLPSIAMSCKGAFVRSHGAFAS